MDPLQKLVQLVHMPVLQEHLGLPHLVVLQLGCLEDFPAAEGRERGGERGEVSEGYGWVKGEIQDYTLST